MKINNKLFLFGMAFILSLICICMFPQEVQAADSQGNFVIVLDPGHGPNKEDAPGSNDPGAIAGGVTEANVTMKLAQYAKEELEQYEGVKVYLTRYNNCPTIYNRVEIAKNYNADLLVSLHINSGGGGASRGAAIWVTQDKTQVEYNQKASEAANIILRNISSLGIQNNGVQTKSGKADEWYDSGVVQDYYGIIRYAQRVKMRSLLVEHCFIDNDSDRNYINSDEKIKRLAQADVKGIVEAYQLNKKSENKKQLQSISMQQSEINIQMNSNSSYFMPLTYTPSNVSNKTVYWYTSNSSVATVSGGNIYAKGEGEATITAISGNRQKIAKCKVIVSKPQVPLTGIRLKENNVTVELGKTGYIGAIYEPENASDKVLYWSSSNENVAKVNEGVITSVGKGTATLTAISRAGGKTASCTVTVEDPNFVHINEITMKSEEVELKTGETGWVGVTYNPSNATNKVLTWKSSNEKVATVKEGTIKAVGLGTATLTATSEDGGKTATCKVTVTDGKKHIESISLKTDSIEMKPGEGKTIYAEYNPSNVDDKTLYWKSSNEKVVTVNEGYAKAIGEGTATVTATSRDGGKTASCKVTVTSGTVKLQSIQISSSTEILTKGEGKTIYVTYNPNNVTDKTLYWSSSNEKVATIKEGYVKAVGEGIATLTARSKDGNKTASCKVVVTDKVKEMKSISLETKKETMNIGEGKTIYAKYNPYNVKDKTLYWISNNEKVVTVSEGYVKAAGKGTATITAVSRDGGKTATCEITVK